MNVKHFLEQVLRGMPVVAAAAMPLSAMGQIPPSVADQRMTLLPPGPLSTKGNQIVDQKGRNVRLACIGWNQVNEHIPLETQTHLMATQGFNCIRFSWVNATMQKDLEMIDRVAAAASKAGLRLVLDNHTNEPGHSERDNWGAQQKNGLWYDLGGGSDGTDGGGNRGTTTDEKFLADWQAVAKHYAGNHTIIGYDLRNEPLGWPGMSVWGGDSDRDIRAMYIRVGNAIQAIDPDKLIIVEPPDGNCRGIRKYPITLNVPNKLVYSVHEYPNEISGIKIGSVLQRHRPGRLAHRCRRTGAFNRLVGLGPSGGTESERHAAGGLEDPAAGAGSGLRQAAAAADGKIGRSSCNRRWGFWPMGRGGPTCRGGNGPSRQIRL